MGLKLLPGDVLLVVPLKKPLCIPRLTQSGLCGLWTALWYGAAHAAVVAGNVIEQSMKEGIRALDWDAFVKSESETFRQFWIYVVRPKNADKHHREKFVQVAQDHASKSIPYNFRHAFTMPAIMTTPYKHPEPTSISAGTICSALVAWLLKQAGIDIGKRSSIAFSPGTFLHSRKFKTVARMKYSDGKPVDV